MAGLSGMKMLGWLHKTACRLKSFRMDSLISLNKAETIADAFIQFHVLHGGTFTSIWVLASKASVLCMTPFG